MKPSSMQELEQLEQRIRALEDVAAIQQLKARYLRACDRKLPDAVRDCFVQHGAVIEAQGFATMQGREAWVELFTRLAVDNPAIMDMHHGHNADITLTGPDTATGLWDLEFCQINIKERTVVNMACEYHNDLRRENGQWKIHTLRSRQTSFIMRTVDADGLEKVVALGQAPAAGFIENA